MAALFVHPNASLVTIAQIVDAGQLGRSILALDTVTPGSVIAASPSDGALCTASDTLIANQLGRALLALDSIAAGAVLATNVGNGAVCTSEDCIASTEAGRNILQCSSPDGYAYLMTSGGGSMFFQNAGPSAAHYYGPLTIENGVVVLLT